MTLTEAAPHGIVPDSPANPPVLELPAPAGSELPQNTTASMEKSPVESTFVSLGHLGLEGFIEPLRERVQADHARQQEIVNNRRFSSVPEETTVVVGREDQQSLIPAQRQITPGHRAHRRRSSNYASRQYSQKANLLDANFSTMD